jgi:hypothetical protein
MATKSGSTQGSPAAEASGGADGRGPAGDVSGERDPNAEAGSGHRGHKRADDPPIRYTMNVAAMTTGPGAISPMATRSKNYCPVSQWCCSTTRA